MEGVSCVTGRCGARSVMCDLTSRCTGRASVRLDRLRRLLAVGRAGELMIRSLNDMSTSA
jgi:hypothetical protein